MYITLREFFFSKKKYITQAVRHGLAETPLVSIRLLVLAYAIGRTVGNGDVARQIFESLFAVLCNSFGRNNSNNNNIIVIIIIINNIYNNDINPFPARAHALRLRRPGE